MMYRKCILFDDLAVNNDGKEGEDIYASPKVVEIYDKINSYVAEYGYKPTRYIYEPVVTSKPGIYTALGNDAKPETAITMQDMIGSVLEMEQLFQKQLLFTVEKKRQFYENNPVQQTLRQEVQDLHEKIAKMKEEYRQIKIRLDKSDNSNRELDDQTAQLNKKDLQIQALKLEVDEHLRSKKDREAKI
jgi:hypothetical protein